MYKNFLPYDEEQEGNSKLIPRHLQVGNISLSFQLLPAVSPQSCLSQHHGLLKHVCPNTAFYYFLSSSSKTTPQTLAASLRGDRTICSFPGKRKLELAWGHGGKHPWKQGCYEVNLRVKASPYHHSAEVPESVLTANYEQGFIEIRVILSQLLLLDFPFEKNVNYEVLHIIPGKKSLSLCSFFHVDS